MLVFLAASAFAASGPQYLFNRVDYPSGAAPTGVAVADFNGDGRPDIAVANQADNTVSVFLGQANGTLGPKLDLATASSPMAVAVGDFNGDGKPDLAVAAGCGVGCGLVSILLGNGDGTFSAHVDYATAPSPLGLVVSDFNGDGFADLALVDSGTVSILLGKGDGTFAPHVDYPAGASATALALADFNGDGITDLAVADSCGSTCGYVSVLLGNRNGTFQPAKETTASPGPLGIAAGDFDGDKIPDLVLTHSIAPWAVSFLKGNGDGTFQTEQQIATSLPTSVVAAADLNADGKLDFVVTDVFHGGSGVFLGNGNGTFQAESVFSTGAYPLPLAISDMNGDGNLDLVIADWESNHVTVLLGNGDGTFSPRIDAPTGSSSLSLSAVIADFNGDGIPDLAVAENSAGVVVLLGKGKGAFHAPINTALDAGSLAAADFNGDGRIDLAFSTGNGAAVALGNGDGTFGPPLTAINILNSPPFGLVVGDFNNDGNQDIVVAANGFVQSQLMYIALGNGDGTFQPPKPFFNSTSYPTAVAAADFNHDGKLDLVVTLNPNGIAVMLGNGDGTFQSPVTYPTDELPGGLTVADVNGDGIPDIIATGNLVDVFLGKGDGTFSASVNYNGGNFPQQVTTGDVNGDGKVDIVASAEGNGAVGALEILLGNGDGTFLPPLEIASGSFGFITGGDLNQDGTTDLFVSGIPGSLFLSGPMATLSPVAMNFGSIGVSSTSPAQTLTLANSGNAPLDIADIQASSPYGTTNNCGSSIGLFSSCTASVTFTPETAGSIAGTLAITDNAPRGQQAVALLGSAFVDFSLTPASTTMTLQPGGQGTDVITFAGLGGSFGSAIQVTCSVAGSGTLPACSLSASSVTPGSQSATSTLTVTEPASAAQLGPLDLRFPQILWGAWLSLFVVVAVPGKKIKKFSYRLRSWVLIPVLILFSACGSSNGGGSSLQSYVVVVTGTSGAIQHTAQVNVTIN